MIILTGNPAVDFERMRMQDPLYRMTRDIEFKAKDPIGWMQKETRKTLEIDWEKILKERKKP